MRRTTLIEKAWGEEEVIWNSSLYCSKLLHVLPFHVCSIHRHLLKDETFYVLGGQGAISVDGTPHPVLQGDVVHIPPGTLHCFATATGMTLLEVSTNHEDSDVERIAPSHRLDPVQDADLWKLLGLA